MNILYFSLSNWDHCWTGRHHLLSRLSKRGHKILFIDPVWDKSSRPLKDNIKILLSLNGIDGLKERDKNLFNYTYSYLPSLGWKCNTFLFIQNIKKICKRLGFIDPLVLCAEPDAKPLINNLNHSKIIYYGIDEMTAFGGIPIKEQIQIRQREESLLKDALMVLAVSPVLKERFSKLNKQSYLLPNGVDCDHYSPTRLQRLPPHPELKKYTTCIGFFGSIDERMDQDLIVKMAQAHPEWTIVLVGRIKKNLDVSNLSAQPNVIFLGFQDYDQLPGIIKHWKVCLIPYVLNDLAQACSPIKVYEYLATGLPVVSTPLKGLYTCKDVIYLGKYHKEFIRNVELALNENDSNLREQRLQTAKKHDWNLRTDQLEQHLLRVDATSHGFDQEKVIYRPKELDNLSYRIIANKQFGPSPIIKNVIRIFNFGGIIFYAFRWLRRKVLSEKVNIRKIFITRRETALGDTIVFIPALKLLRRSFPEAKIVLGIRDMSFAAELIKHANVIDEIIKLDFDDNPGISRIRKGLKLFLEGYDLVITGEDYFLKPESFFSGSPYRYGLYSGQEWERLNNRLLPFDMTQHESMNNVRLINQIRNDFTNENSLNTDEVLNIAEDLPVKSSSMSNFTNDSKNEISILMHPGTKKKSRQWPNNRYAQLAQKLLESDSRINILFSGVKEEERKINRLIRNIPDIFQTRTRNLAGKTDLPTLIGIMKKCHVFVSADTGVMHLARAIGCRQIALLGPENEYRWGPSPWGKGKAITIRHEVPCAPCVKKECPMHYCMRGIQVDEVYLAIQQLLKDNLDEYPSIDSKTKRRSWPNLAASGFTLPLVSVILCDFRKDQFIPINSYQMIQLMKDEVLKQTYPNIEFSVFKSSNNPNEDLCQIIQNQTHGEYIVLLTPNTYWHSNKIGDDVAVLVRNNKASLAASSPFTHYKSKYKGMFTAKAGMIMARKEWMELITQMNRDKRLTFKQLTNKQNILVGKELLTN